MKPTTENIINMLDKNAIGRNQYVATFLEMLDNVDENFTIFINGDWGTGKTFLVKQIYTLLTYYNEYIKEELKGYNTQLDQVLQKDSFKDLKLEKNFVPIYYNAWNNDSHIDPINSIIFNIIKEHDILKDYQKESSDVIDKIASVLDMANIWSNGSVKELVSTFKRKDIIPEITTMENLKETLNLLLDKLLVERGDKLVIFVDELDRCNPIYSIKLLERIKHFFDHENIIFVFSVNENELTNTISNYYGQNFDSHRYLNKFFDISIDLPKVNISNYMEYLGIERNSKYFNKTIHEIIEYYNFTMRDCIRYYQSLKIIEDLAGNCSNYGFSDDRGYNMIKMFILPALMAIKIIDLKGYIKIINGNGFDIFFNIINNVDILNRGIGFYMKKDKDGNISEEEYKEQFLEMYNAIFNNNSNKEYDNDEITLGKYSYEFIMESISLLKKGLKY
jgi:nucleoside-triphosphatase THEP1